MIFSCRKDKVIYSSNVKLSFTQDTLTFDTVFTSLGSTTEFFKVLNTHKQPIIISKIDLAGGNSSQFRINIDGIPGISARDIKIEGEDSMYIFVEVTVDPSLVGTPFIIEDSIIFITNGNMQRVLLTAWGQNAYYYNGNIICSMKWISDKPHVVYNSVLVDSGCTLTIKEGTHVHFHDRSRLFVSGTLKVNGTAADPVVFQGDRLESFYEDLPGQWDGIHFLRGSINNEINYAIIENGVVGIRVDSLSENSNPNLIIKNSIVRNTLSSGILGLTAEIQGENCLIYNNGQYSCQLEIGGVYDFKHCTFANYSSILINHKSSVVRLSNLFDAFIPADDIYADLNATFTNCIIYGSLKEELDFNFDGKVDSTYLFDNCIIRSEKNIIPPFFTANKVNDDPKFVLIAEDDFHLDSLSSAIDAGKNIGIMIDLEDNVRSDGKPDIGCYEKQ
ncbi:MAG: hypothetical protein IIA45_11580 [Bacteroidetes bacterium]|nr:hypothetical protein [Bacteroidota bacterium]